MAAASIPFYSTPAATPAATTPLRERCSAVAERSRLKAQDRADFSANAEEFMRYYDTTLSQLRQGMDVEDGRHPWLTPVQQAAEVEALAAHRIHQSCYHQQRCACPECRQRRIERAARAKI